MLSQARHYEFVATQRMTFTHKRKTNYRRRPRIQNLLSAEDTQNVTEGTYRYVAQPQCVEGPWRALREAGSQRVSLRTTERFSTVTEVATPLLYTRHLSSRVQTSPPSDRLALSSYWMISWQGFSNEPFQVRLKLSGDCKALLCRFWVRLGIADQASVTVKVSRQTVAGSGWRSCGSVLNHTKGICGWGWSKTFTASRSPKYLLITLHHNSCASTNSLHKASQCIVGVHLGTCCKLP